MAQLEVTATVPLPIGAVWKAHENVRLLERIYPPYPATHLKESNIICQVGVRFTLQLEWIPGIFYQDWRVEIVRWEPPTCFVDTQIEGPFQAWEHTHRFVPLSSQETRLIDSVKFTFNPLLDEPLISPGLWAMFQFRTHNLRQILLETCKPL